MGGTVSKRMVRSDWRSSNAFEDNDGYCGGAASDRRFAGPNEREVTQQEMGTYDFHPFLFFFASTGHF